MGTVNWIILSLSQEKDKGVGACNKARHFLPPMTTTRAKACIYPHGILSSAWPSPGHVALIIIRWSRSFACCCRDARRGRNNTCHESASSTIAMNRAAQMLVLREVTHLQDSSVDTQMAEAYLDSVMGMLGRRHQLCLTDSCASERNYFKGLEEKRGRGVIMKTSSFSILRHQEVQLGGPSERARNIIWSEI